MLFFFELALFVLIMLTLGLGEFVGRAVALTLWLGATTASLLGYLLAGRGRGVETMPSELHEKWRRTLLYNWRRTNALLLLGAPIAGVWYWLSAPG